MKVTCVISTYIDRPTVRTLDMPSYTWVKKQLYHDSDFWLPIHSPHFAGFTRLITNGGFEQHLAERQPGLVEGESILNI